LSPVGCCFHAAVASSRAVCCSLPLVSCPDLVPHFGEFPWADLSRGKVLFGTASFTVPPYFFVAINRLLFLLHSLLSLGALA